MIPYLLKTAGGGCDYNGEEDVFSPPVATVIGGGTERPIRKTEPAKLVAANSACHVHATPVLLNGFLTTGAFLGVSRDPKQALRITSFLVLLGPLSRGFTTHRSMSFFAASPAKPMLITATCFNTFVVSEIPIKKARSKPGLGHHFISFLVST
ncbi:hypothetical protein PIB30_035082 [Stylosanthes scabra]|uniref:Uncharacterized protein n=1 Tax=Stylosanthes scabra TaxID=79078 RepID=A0ABU6QD26_9FABA|nr:hypothetical protein [Stylosanthes scabra]